MNNTSLKENPKSKESDQQKKHAYKQIDSGMVIGICERIIVFLFCITKVYSAIAFVITIENAIEIISSIKP